MRRLTGSLRSGVVLLHTTYRRITSYNVCYTKLLRNGHDAMVKARNQFLQLAQQNKLLTQVRASGLEDVAAFSVKIDDQKAAALNLSTSNINSTLSTALGGIYVNDFLNKSRVKKVYVQGVITSYSIHYTKLYEIVNGWAGRVSSSAMFC